MQTRAFYLSPILRRTLVGVVTPNRDGTGEFVADEDWRCGIHLTHEQMDELATDGQVPAARLFR